MEIALLIAGGLVAVMGIAWKLRAQLTALNDFISPRVTQRPLLNKSERLLHSALWIALSELNRNDLHLFTQVSYGEFLEAGSAKTRASFNSKRADFVIADANFVPKVVIEYQGSGHFGSNWISHQNASARDAIKRAVLRRAGLPLIEVHEGFALADIRAQLKDVLQSASAQPHMKRITRSGARRRLLRIRPTLH